MGLYRRKDSPYWWLLLERRGAASIREATRIPIGPDLEASRAEAQRAYQRRMADLESGRNRRAVVLNGARVRAEGRGWTYVYFIQSGTHVKIGRAINVARRMAALQIGHPTRLVLLAAVPAHIGLERILQRFFDKEREQGEWFRISPRLEMFLGSVCGGDHPVTLLARLNTSESRAVD